MGQQGHSEPPSARIASSDQQTCLRLFDLPVKRTSSYEAEGLASVEDVAADDLSFRLFMDAPIHSGCGSAQKPPRLCG